VLKGVVQQAVVDAGGNEWSRVGHQDIHFPEWSISRELNTPFRGQKDGFKT
jgi:hypothetical protein